MKNYTMSKKQKRTRSPSNSSHYTISDDDSPKQKTEKSQKRSEDTRHHRKHIKHNHKHRRHPSVDQSSDNDVRDKYKSSENEKRLQSRDYSPEVRVKEEPTSEDERDYKNKHRHNDQSRNSRSNGDPPQRNYSKHSKEDARKRPESNGDPPQRNYSKHNKEDARKRPESNGDPPQRNYSKHNKEDARKRPEHAGSRYDDQSRRPVKDEPSSEPEWGKKDIKKEEKEPPKNNAKPDFGLSGKLTEDANTFNGVVIKYSEPPEARKPKRRWRLYPFKGETSLPVLHIHRQSAYLFGRDRLVADIPIDHPSCSKQHAALQYRLVPFTRNDGSKGRQIKLYVIDLESANGTYLNNQKIDQKKYYELQERDVVKFGYSSREYVLLHEHSKDSENDDDVNGED